MILQTRRSAKTYRVNAAFVQSHIAMTSLACVWATRTAAIYTRKSYMVTSHSTLFYGSLAVTEEDSGFWTSVISKFDCTYLGTVLGR